MGRQTTGNKDRAPKRNVGAITLRIPRPPANWNTLSKRAQRAYKYLIQVGEMAHMIAIDLDEIDRLNALVEVRAASYREKLGSYTPNPDQRYDVVARIIDRKAELDAQIHRMLDAQEQIREAIARVGDRTLRSILQLRYLMCMDFDSIAEEVNYSVRRIFTLHIKALEALSVPDDFDEDKYSGEEV